MELSSCSFTLIQQSCYPFRDFCQGPLEKKVLPEEVVEEDVVVDVGEEEAVLEVRSQERKLQNVGFIWGAMGYFGHLFCGVFVLGFFFKAAVKYLNINSYMAKKNVIHVSVWLNRKGSDMFQISWARLLS